MGFFFFLLLLLLCFSSPEQCPSAAGSPNGPPAHLRPSSRPRYLFFLIWPGPASTAASHCLSEGSTRGGQGPGTGANPNTLVFVSGSTPAAANKPFETIARPIKDARSRTLKAFGSRHPSCVHVWRGKQIPHPSDGPRGGPAGVCLSPSPVRKEGWSVFSGQTPSG